MTFCLTLAAVQSAPKNFTPLKFSDNFLKRLRIFKQNFTRLLSIQIYACLLYTSDAADE